jgi:hypothetical protein
LAVLQGVKDVGKRLAKTKGGTSTSAFKSVYHQGILFEWNVRCEGCRDTETNLKCGDNYDGDCKAHGAVTASKTHIIFATTWIDFGKKVNHVVHELGHAFSNYYLNQDTQNRIADTQVSNAINNGSLPSSREFGFAGGWTTWQQSQNPASNEVFADLFLGWTYDQWAGNDFGSQRSDFMNSFMDDLINP